MTARVRKICRVAGIVVIAGALLLLPWKILQLENIKATHKYFFPTDAERETLANYLHILIGIAIGCVLLWLGNPKRKPEK